MLVSTIAATYNEWQLYRVHNNGAAMDVGVIIKNQYRVVEHIGRGGMADVWSAQDTSLNRVVAVKTIAQNLTTEVDPVSMFRREAQTIARLEHPNILPIYDFGEFEGKLYIVMRYVTGGSLEDVLQKGPMPPQDALRMGRSMASALDYAHSNSVVHLDLKPPNILLGSQQAPYLADFGLATVLDPQGRARNPGSGTLLYMAPEQLTSEVIDHRADVYSFAIMIYHMLTGKLPFDATTSLALKQLQYQEVLPDLDRLGGNVPPDITEVLRWGTAIDPDVRPQSVMELMRRIESVLQGNTIDISGGRSKPQDRWQEDVGEFEEFWEGDEVVNYMNVGNMVTEQISTSDDMMLLEAVDIYSRAHHAWANGQGRFLLGVSHFMLMSGYYKEAERYALKIDSAGYQMLLRGALEYDHDIEFWWDKLDNDSRRWVCLHTIRSENAPARIRAFHYLETLPDDRDAPRIPRLVVQALQIETFPEAKIAALRVLGKRATLQKSFIADEDLPKTRNTILTGTLLRVNLLLAPESDWRDVVYSPEIDLFIAELALNREEPIVADFAARTIGQMRSKQAVRFLAGEQRNGRRGALRALALVRDEAQSLPSAVSIRARTYAWLANSWRRTTEQPMQLVWRFVLGLLGGWVAMGAHVYITFRSNAIFTPQRWGNTIAVGLVFGVFTGFLVLFGDAFSRRLRGFWPARVRLVASLTISVLWAALAWAGFTWFFLGDAPQWNLMKFAGFGLALGFVLTSLFNLPGWLAFIVTTISTYVPIFISYRAVWFRDVPRVALPTALTFLLFVLFLMLIGAEIPFRLREMKRKGRALIYSMSLGFIFGALAWIGYKTFFLEQRPYWLGILTAGAGAMIGFGIVTRSKLSNFQSYLVIVLATWLPMFLLYGLLFNTPWQMPVGFAGINAPVAITLPSLFYPNWLEPIPLLSQQVLDKSVVLLSYDLRAQILSVGLPMALVIALGGHARDLLGNVLAWIGEPESTQERTGVLTGFLLYAMLGSAIIASFFLFTMLQGGLYSIAALIWGLATFLCGLAAWRWKRWGAVGLMISAGILAAYRIFTLISMTVLYIASRSAMPPAAHMQLNDLLIANILAAVVSTATLIALPYALRPVLGWHSKKALAEQMQASDPMATGKVQMFA